MRGPYGWLIHVSLSAVRVLRGLRMSTSPEPFATELRPYQPESSLHEGYAPLNATLPKCSDGFPRPFHHSSNHSK